MLEYFSSSVNWKVIKQPAPRSNNRLYVTMHISACCSLPGSLLAMANLVLFRLVYAKVGLGGTNVTCHHSMRHTVGTLCSNRVCLPADFALVFRPQKSYCRNRGTRRCVVRAFQQEQHSDAAAQQQGASKGHTSRYDDHKYRKRLMHAQSIIFERSDVFLHAVQAAARAVRATRNPTSPTRHQPAAAEAAAAA